MKIKEFYLLLNIEKTESTRDPVSEMSIHLLVVLLLVPLRKPVFLTVTLSIPIGPILPKKVREAFSPLLEEDPDWIKKLIKMIDI